MLALGGAFEAVDELKGRLVRSMAERTRRIESGRTGRRRRQPLHRDRSRRRWAAPSRSSRSIPPSRPRWWTTCERVAGRPGRRPRFGERSTTLRAAASGTDNLMPATIALAQAGGTTGEWAGALREVFGEFRAPDRRAGRRRQAARTSWPPSPIRVKDLPGGPPRLLVAKPGLDGHSNGAEQIAVAARDAGHGGRVLGHPPDAGADRGLGARRGPGRDRALRSCPAATASSSPRCSTASPPRGSTRWSWSAGSSPRRTGTSSWPPACGPSTRRRTSSSARIMDEITSFTEERRAAV